MSTNGVKVFTGTRVLKRATSADRVKIANHERHWSMTHWRKNINIECSFDFELTIDVDKLFDYMAKRAAWPKAGKSVLQGGLVTMRRRKSRELSRIESDVPIPPGYEIVEEKASA